MGYFKPLRRKIGVVMLGLALVFAMAWVRSHGRVELIRVDGLRSSLSIISGCGKFQVVDGVLDGWIAFDDSTDQTKLGRMRLDFIKHPAVAGWLKLKRTEFFTPAFDIVMSSGEIDLESGLKVWLIPYWSITVPLTVLSAWLLLNRPRQKPDASKPAP